MRLYFGCSSISYINTERFFQITETAIKLMAKSPAGKIEIWSPECQFLASFPGQIAEDLVHDATWG
jgi:hypothetical protein